MKWQDHPQSPAGRITERRGKTLPGAIAITVILIVSLSACDVGGGNATPVPAQRPQDFTISYVWSSAPLAPPYSYAYTIAVGPGAQGKITYWPNISEEPPTWTENVTITDAQMDQLYKLAVEKRLFRDNWRVQTNHPIGGSYSEHLQGVAWGKQLSVPSYLESEDNADASAIYNAIKTFVPVATSEKLEKQRQDYKDEYLKQHK
jgi:hypothetical protein